MILQAPTDDPELAGCLQLGNPVAAFTADLGIPAELAGAGLVKPRDDAIDFEDISSDDDDPAAPPSTTPTPDIPGNAAQTPPGCAPTPQPTTRHPNVRE